MTILAVCGPIGSDIKSFSQKCFDLIDPKKVILFDASTYNSNADLLSLIQQLNIVQQSRKDVIIFGTHIFTEEQLRSKFDIKVFIELDEDLCLAKQLKLSSELRKLICSEVISGELISSKSVSSELASVEPVSSEPTSNQSVSSELLIAKDIKYYKTKIKPENDTIRISGRFANFILPQYSSGVQLLNLLIDDKEKTLKKPETKKYDLISKSLLLQQPASKQSQTEKVETTNLTSIEYN